MGVLAALFVQGGSAVALIVDNKMPQGNIFVAGIKGDTVELHNEVRDTVGWWFWWAFRVRGAEGRTLKFKFRPDPLTGWYEYVSTRGAVVSTDLGATWSYTEKEPFTKNEFTYTFGKDAKEVWFAMCIPHGLREWNALVARHAGDAEHFRVGTLCQTKKGRPAPFARVGRLDGRAAFPHDPARDYGNWIYPSTAALRDWIQNEWKGRLDVGLDIHCPHYNNPLMHQIFIAPGKNEVRQRRMAQLVYEKRRGLTYHPKNDVAWRTPEADMPGFVPRSRGRCEYRSAP